jgi:hypothetical protein
MNTVTPNTGIGFIEVNVVNFQYCVVAQQFDIRQWGTDHWYEFVVFAETGFQ